MAARSVFFDFGCAGQSWAGGNLTGFRLDLRVDLPLGLHILNLLFLTVTAVLDTNGLAFRSCWLIRR